MPKTRPRSFKAEGITSYKAIGASGRDSLAMVIGSQAKPPYGTVAVCIPTAPSYPAAANLPFPSTWTAPRIRIFTMETMDETASRWMVGKEATLVGLPQKSSPTGVLPKPLIVLCTARLRRHLGARTRALPRPACGRSSPTTSARGR